MERIANMRIQQTLHVLLIITFALTVGMTVGLSGVAQAHVTHSLAEAKSLAFQNDLPIVVDFSAEWCGPCQAFLKATAEDAELKAALHDIVLLKLDAEKGEGAKLALGYDVRGYPSFVMTNAGGEVIDRWRGYESTAEWIATLDHALADLTTLEEKQARFAADPNLEDAKTLARAADNTGDYQSAVEYYRSAKSFDAVHASVYDMKIFHAMAWGSKQHLYNLDQITAAADDVINDEERQVEDVMMVAYVMKKVATGFGQPARMVPYLKEALVVSEGSSDEYVREVRRELEVEKALYIDQDKEKAHALKREHMPEGWQESSQELNNFAWWCFQNNVNLEEAETLARKGVELAEDEKERANVLDTVAEICNARGNCYEAVSLIQNAIELNPESEYLRKQLDKFQTLLAEAG
jgi:thioredoxin 1